jgi:large subunit ribosomal protein L10e
MASLRKASSYSSRVSVRPYTRKSRNKRKAYIKTIPGLKITKFHLGDQKDSESGKHKFKIRLITEEKCLVRDNALESCRTLLNKVLDKFTPGQYYIELKVYPHHILRENKSAGGQAGADRTSTGMTQSFGTVIGRAAIVGAGKDILFVTCTNERAASFAKTALYSIRPKLPCRTRIIYEKL